MPVPAVVLLLAVVGTLCTALGMWLAQRHQPTRRTLIRLRPTDRLVESIEVAGYIDRDGRQRWAYRHAEDTPVPLSTTLGLLMIAALSAWDKDRDKIRGA